MSRSFSECVVIFTEPRGMNGLMTFFDDFISGEDEVAVECLATFSVDESLNSASNFALRFFPFFQNTGRIFSAIL